MFDFTYNLEQSWGITVALVTAVTCCADLGYRGVRGKKNAYHYIMLLQDVLCLLLYASPWLYVIHSSQLIYLCFRLGIRQTFRIRFHTFALHWLFRALELLPTTLDLQANVHWWLIAFDVGNVCSDVIPLSRSRTLASFLVLTQRLAVNVLAFGQAFVWTNTWVHDSVWLRAFFAIVWLHQVIDCKKLLFN